jgi:hypothetical protein
MLGRHHLVACVSAISTGIGAPEDYTPGFHRPGDRQKMEPGDVIAG